jgi:hypothetical protein
MQDFGSTLREQAAPGSMPLQQVPYTKKIKAAVSFLAATIAASGKEKTMATTAQLSENSHPGFEGIKAALCPASMDANSNLASGMQPCLRRNGTGSRCSGKERDVFSFQRANPEVRSRQSHLSPRS